MYLIYLDETGNTGTDLADTQQPIFALGALVIPESCWQPLERDLESSLARLFPDLASGGLEVHGADLRGGRGYFKGTFVADRITLRNEWLAAAQRHGLRFVYRAIVKKRFQKWVQATFGTGVLINPHVAAFPLVARVVDDYLASLSDQALGMFISDENKEIVHDIEKSIKVLRGAAGILRLSRIVEKGFFIDSTKSRMLQLCDLCVLTARKKEEATAGMNTKPADESGAKLLEPLIHRGNEALQDVLTWLASQHSSGAKK